MVSNVLPETLEDGADMVPYSELIIELTGSTSVLNIWPKESVKKSLSQLYKASKQFDYFSLQSTQYTHQYRTSWVQGPAVWRTTGGSPSFQKIAEYEAVQQGWWQTAPPPTWR